MHELQDLCVFHPKTSALQVKKGIKNDGIHIFDRRLYLPALPKPDEILALKAVSDS